MKNDYVQLHVTLYEVKDGIKVPVKFSKRFKKSGVLVHFNSVHKLLRLRKTSTAVLIFLAEIMDSNTNEFVSCRLIKNAFQSHLKGMGVKPVKVPTFDKAIQELIRENFIIKTPVRGTYIMNPRHLHKTTALQRKKILLQLMKLVDDEKWQKTNLIEALGTLE